MEKARHSTQFMKVCIGKYGKYLLQKRKSNREKHVYNQENYNLEGKPSIIGIPKKLGSVILDYVNLESLNKRIKKTYFTKISKA